MRLPGKNRKKRRHSRLAALLAAILVFIVWAILLTAAFGLWS